MINLIAILDSNKDLRNQAKIVNNARTDGNYFYTYENKIMVCNAHKELSESDQLKELKWFIGTEEFTIEKQ
jgi:hypothetical protein